ncbi:MAG TPA: SCO family protein [Polyangia bacterium]|jgi:protein SCO1/2|nr:SCO family protein [Polyangia bacterium]
MKRASAFGLAAASLLLSTAVAHAEPQIVFPQGSAEPLAALQDIDVIEHLGDRVPRGLTFTDVTGAPMALDTLLGQGRPVVVTLGYHRCPMLCGLVLDGLAKAAHTVGLGLGKDYTAVDISIDPGEDPKLLQQNQHRVLEQAGQGLGKPLTRADWPFWVSSADGGAAARQLADAVGFRYKYDPLSKQFAHVAVAFVLTPDGVISRYLYGVDYPARDFRMALVEASGGKVGTSLDKVILSCYRYDPSTRRYGPFVYGFMRIGAGLVFFALAGLMTVLWRKELAMRKRRVAVGAADGRTV